MKKIFTYAIILSASLFGSAIANAQEQKAVVLDKYVTGPVNDQYTLTLEAYATGSSAQTITTESKPLDVVLVLDNSHSMNSAINFRDTTLVPVATGTTLSTSKEYIAVIDGVEYHVKGFTHNEDTYTARASKAYSYSGYGSNSYYYKDGDNYYLVSRISTDVYTKSAKTTYSYDDINNAGIDYYFKYGDIYYEVQAERTGNGKNRKYSLYYENPGKQYIGTRNVSSSTTTIYTGDLYTLSGSTYTLSYVKGGTTYYLSGTGVTTTEPTSVTSSNSTIWTGTLYDKGSVTRYYYRYGTTTPTSYTSGSALYTSDSQPVYGTTTPLANVTELSEIRISNSSKTRLQVLKESVHAFLNILEEDAGTDATKHQIGIAIFGGHGNLHSTISHFSTDYDALHYKVDSIPLPPSSGTPSHLGMQEAVGILQGAKAREDVERIVVFFTDGDPYWETQGGVSHDSQWVGAQTINEAYTIKNTYNATIYSIGLFSSQPAEGSNINKFMNNVSSKYPDAQTDGSHYPEGRGEGPEPGGYYQTSDGTDLTSIFEAIAESTTTGGASVTLDAESTTVVDILTADFALPEGADINNIGLYVDEVTGYNTTTEVYSFGNRTNLVPTGGVRSDYITISDDSYVDETTGETLPTKRLVVTGFDFSKEDTPANGTDPIRYGNWVGPRTTIEGGTETTVYKGKRLVITIPIVPTDDYAGGYDLPTNRDDSGIYVKDKTGTDKPVEFFPVPELDFPSIGIIKIGLAKGESATYRVQRIADPSGTATTDTPYSVILTGDGTSNPAYIILKDIPEGTYRVAESMWSWTYSVKSVTVKTGNSVESITGEAAATSQVLSNDQTETWPTGITERVKCVLFIFENEKGDEDPDNAEGVVQNKFADEFGKSEASVTSITSKTQE